MLRFTINGRSLAEIMNGDGVPGLDALGDIELLNSPGRANPEAYTVDIERINPPNLKRTDNGYMPDVPVLNQKASLTVSFPPLKAGWIQNLLRFIRVEYPPNGIAYETALTDTTFNISYLDMTGYRTMECYVGLKLSGRLIIARPGADEEPMWKGVQMSFIER